MPKKIQVYSDIFVFDNSNNIYEHKESRTNLLSIYNGNILNYKVEIIEEDKKIEKIETYDKDGNIFIDEQCFKYVPIDKDNLTANEQVLVEKINEIIDRLNEGE